MSLIQAVFLGIIQGLSEFLPISSSGHLILAGNFLGVHQSLAFDVALHVGTLTAVLAVFGKDYWGMLKNLGRDNRMARAIVIGTLPAVVAGFAFADLAENLFRQNWLVAFNLIVVAGLMLLAERVGDKTRKLSEIKLPDALIIGSAQALALVPGVSRSGITITTGMLNGFTREAAMRFSFLLSAPVIAGAALKIFSNQEALAEVAANQGLFMAGVISAGVSGYLAIRFMLSYLAKHKLDVFAYYRIALGAIVLLVGAR